MYYDNRNRLTWSVEPDPTANTTAPSCDVTPVTGAWPNRPVSHFVYDKNNNLLEMTDPRGNTTNFEYDALDRLVKVIEPLPGASLETGFDEVLENGRPVSTFAYDNFGNLWSVTDALNNTTDYRYDEWNRIVSVEAPDPDGPGPEARPKIEFAYEASPFGWITRVTDPLGRIAESQTDFLGRTQYVAAPAVDGVRPVTWYEYHADGAIKSVTDALQNRTKYEYDDRARLITITAPDPDKSGPLVSPVTSYTYNRANQLLSVTDLLNRETTYAYDFAGRVAQVTSPDPDGGGAGVSPTTSYTYDAIGNMLQTTDALSHSTTYGYDHLFRRTRVTDANGDATQFGYDLAHNMTTLTDANNNVTTWAYDGSGRVMSESIVIDSVTLQRAYKYDAVGNARKVTDRRGLVTEYQYDNLYRTTGETWKSAGGGGSAIRQFDFDYDLVGNLLSASDVNSATYNFVYDDLDRLNLEQQDIGGLSSVVLKHNYDLVGNRTQLAATVNGATINTNNAIVGGTADFKTTYAYDALYRQTSVTQTGQSGGNAVASKHVAFAYDVASQMTQVIRYAATSAVAASKVASSDYVYDLTGRLTSLTHNNAAGTTTIAGYTWTFDTANRITAFNNTAHTDENVTYDYDARDQLTEANYSALPDESYAYDSNGNRTSHTIGQDNRVTNDGTYTYLYDAEGNRTKRTKIVGGSVTDYTWDHRNRLTKITDRASDGGEVTKSVEYTYDVFDRRVGKLIDLDGAGTQQTAYSETHVFDGAHLALIFRDPDASGSQPAALRSRLLHGPAVDMILAQEEVTSPTTPGNVLWALADNLGTIRDVVNSAGVVQNHLQYDSFGKVIAESNAAIDFVFAYTGRDRDEESDLYNYRARYYDPALGRFVSNDPIGFNAGDANLYRYVGNQSITRTDPSGLQDIMQHEIDMAKRRSEYDAQMSRRRQAVLAVIAAAERDHSQYAYYKECGIDDFFKLLRQTVAITRFQPVTRDSLAAIDASAYYRAPLNTVYYDVNDGLSAKNRGTLVHELVHALDDYNDWNITLSAGVMDAYFRSQRNSSDSKSEGIAYITNHMLGRGTHNLRTLEDELNSGKFFDNAALQELSPEAYAQSRWGDVCSSFQIYGAGGVFFGGGMRNLDAQDFADARTLLKLNFQLSKLKPIYQQLLKDKGVETTLTTPVSVPEYLR